jgi:hypothetical protein
MTEIKVYKEMLRIELKDWTTLNSEKTVDDLRKYIENAKDVLLIDWILFNKYEFKKAYPYNPSDVEQFILSQDRYTQQILRLREKQKKERLDRWFRDVAEVIAYLEKKKEEEKGENIQNFN